MAARRRLIAMVVLVLAMSCGSAFAQTDGPDPNSPIQIPTSPADDDLPSDDATPATGASSVAPSGKVDLAAMTLDSSAIPDDFILIGERYRSIEEYIELLLGQLNPDEVRATGLDGYYQSYYINADGNTLRMYIFSYDTVEGVQAGFDLLEDEQTLVPNGALVDRAGLAGVGEAPSEITTGTIENGDGTRTGVYDVTFRIDRFQIGAAMETRDGSGPLTDAVDDTARALAERVTNVVAGNDVSGVDYRLPNELIQLEMPASYEGYQSFDETILIDDPESLTAGYLSGYYRAASFSENVTSILPYVTIGVNQFASAADVDDALTAPEAMMPFFPDLEEIGGFELEGADAVVALSFSSPQGEGIRDSVRLFVKVGDKLISIDVQGMDSLEAAELAAMGLADLQLACTIDGVCDVPGGLEPGTEA